MLPVAGRFRTGSRFPQYFTSATFTWARAVARRLGIRWLRRHGGTKVNLYVTNVPGPPQPLWLAGTRLQAALPIAPLVAGVPLAVAALSYAGELAISIQVDDALTDLDTLAAGVADHLDQLTASGRSPAIAGKRA